MAQTDQHIGQRLSLKGQLCTVRYIGPVADKPGTWLGVEWDYVGRGKHNGINDGKVYFTCRSKSPTCASFIRPTQTWDEPRTFLQALQEKYMPDFHESESETVYFSGKQAEEIGFEKFHQRQANLQGIHVLVLDHMRIQHHLPIFGHDLEAEAIMILCADITELDLSGNLFSTFDEILSLCAQLPKLKSLTLDGNRFDVDSKNKISKALPMVKTLSLACTLLKPAEVNEVVSDAVHESVFGSLDTLSLAENEYSKPLKLFLPPSISTLDLSDNRLISLSDLQDFNKNNPMVHTLILKRNRISTINESKAHLSTFSLSLRELDLSYNAIDDFSLFNSITTQTFPELRHLRVTGNPLYKSLTSADGKPLTAEDGYMLTIARIPQLEYLNYSKITEKERLNAETYYLSQIAIELSRAPESQAEEILKKHPRYRELCEDYGEPTIQRNTTKPDIDPNSVAARLVHVNFTLGSTVLPVLRQRSWREEVPKSFPIYAVLGLVGKRLQYLPLDLRLVLETNERDPVGFNDGYAGPEWWDSSDDEAGQDAREEWVKREVELVAGTRALGTFVEDNEANVRVELKDGNGSI